MLSGLCLRRTSQPSGEGPDAIDAEWFLALAWRRVSWWSTTVVSVVAVLLVIADVEALTIVVAPMVLLFSLVTPPVDDVACIVVVVEGAASIHASLSASLAPIPTTRLPTSGGPTGRKGSVTFLVVLNRCYHHHRLDLSDDGCGSVVLGQHGLNRVTECLGDEDVLLRSGEDVLVIHLHLQDFFLDAPTPVGKVSLFFFLSA